MIIGLTGTLGAGKGAVVEFLKKEGFKHFSVREYLNNELLKKGFDLNRDNQVMIANQLRTQNSPSYIVEQLFEKAKQEGGNIIIESIRTPEEVESIKNKGGIILAIDADPKIRYARIIERKSENDSIIFEKFLEQEKREMFSTNPNEQNLSECIKRADFVLENNKDLEHLEKQVKEILEKIPSKQEPKQTTYQRPSWDEYFMKITSVVAERSTCLRHNVGSVIVNDKQILTTGYNGAVKGQTDCLTLGCRKDELNLESGFGSEECRAVHAEQNSIIQAAVHGINIKGATLYCTTIPCRMCAKEIVNAGIKKVITYSNYEGSKGSIKFLQDCGVEFEKIPRPKNIINFKD